MPRLSTKSATSGSASMVPIGPPRSTPCSSGPLRPARRHRKRGNLHTPVLRRCRRAQRRVLARHRQRGFSATLPCSGAAPAPSSAAASPWTAWPPKPTGDSGLSPAGELHLLEDNRHSAYALPASEQASGLALYSLKNGSLLLGAADHWFQFQPARGLFRPLHNCRRRGSSPDRAAERRPGSASSGTMRLPQPGSAVFQLEAYDGQAYAPIARPPAGLLRGTNLLAVFEAQNGDLWLSTERDTACLHEQKWRAFSTPDKTTPEGGTAFLEMADGKNLVRHPRAGLGIRRPGMVPRARRVRSHLRPAAGRRRQRLDRLQQRPAPLQPRAPGSKTPPRKGCPQPTSARCAKTPGATSGPAPPAASSSSTLKPTPTRRAPPSSRPPTRPPASLKAMP